MLLLSDWVDFKIKHKPKWVPKVKNLSAFLTRRRLETAAVENIWFDRMFVAISLSALQYQLTARELTVH